MSAKKATKTTLGVTVYVLIVLAIIAVVGLIFQLTNGFTDKVKTFYVTVDKTIVTDASGGYVITETRPLNGVVRNLSTDSKNKGYSLKVVPNKLDGKDFAFAVDGKTHTFQAEENFTAGFDITTDGDKFSIKPKGNGVTDILEQIYGDTVTSCDDKSYKDMFTLLITSKDGKSVIKLNFSVSGRVTGVYFDKEVIWF